jgi:type IV pilus assembly protein PilC
LATFSYLAIDRSGKESKGSINAPSLEQAADELKKNGLTIAKISAAGPLDREINLDVFTKKPKSRDIAIFCRQFVSIINAGVSVVSALEMLAEQTENKRLRKAIEDCKVSIEKGETLSSAMSQHRDVFSNLFITMVAAGEASGSLDISLRRMAEQEEKQAKLKATIKKASIYPIMVLLVSVCVIYGLLVFVVPTFESMFEQIGGSMPGITLAIIGLSNFVKNHGLLLFLLLAAIIFGVKTFLKTDTGQRFIGTVFIKLPIVGKLTVKTSCARFSRTLSVLLSSGISLNNALQITAQTMTNIHFRESVLDARDDVTMGDSLSEAIQKRSLFPPLVHHMTGIGEESGNIEGMLDRLAEYYEEEVEQGVAQLIAVLEPLIIIFLAVIVGTIIFAVVLPLMNMYAALDSM